MIERIINTIIVSTVLGILCLTGCQKSSESSGGKTINAPNAEGGNKPLTKLETKERQPDVAKDSESGELSKNASAMKTTPLTELEQKFVDRIGGDIPSPNLFKSKNDALNYLKILLKGDEKNIRWYVDFAKEETDGYVKRAYSDDMCAAMEALALKHKDAFELITAAMINKVNYPATYACASKMIGWYVIAEGKTERVQGTIPLLKEAVRQNDRKIRLEAAGALLAAGEVDISLPVLNDLAKQGEVNALAKLFKPDNEGVVRWSKLKFWDKKGLDIVIKSLDYPSNEVKAWAAMALVNLEIDKAKAEAVTLNIVKNLMHKKWNEYGISWDEKRGIVPLPGHEKNFEEVHEKYSSDGRSCDMAMGVLARVKSKRAIPLLSYIKTNNTGAGNVCWENLADKTAERALRAIDGGVDK